MPASRTRARKTYAPARTDNPRRARQMVRRGAQSATQASTVSAYACEQNICVCSNGVVAIGVACTEHRGKICRECHAGYHFAVEAALATECWQNVCKCTNSEGDLKSSVVGFRPVTGVACKTHGATVCEASCAGFAFYHSVTEWSSSPVPAHQSVYCDQNECACTAGTAVADADCTTYTGSSSPAQMCAWCNDNYRLSAGFGSTCVANECKCPNGYQFCRGGYHTPAGKFETPFPGCPNGDSKIAVACKTDGATQCTWCEDGYQMQELESGTWQSGTWQPGFQTYTCAKIPVCVCPNGIPHLGSNADPPPDCQIDGDTRCDYMSQRLSQKYFGKKLDTWGPVHMPRKSMRVRSAWRRRKGSGVYQGRCRCVWNMPRQLRSERSHNKRRRRLVRDWRGNVWPADNGWSQLRVSICLRGHKPQLLHPR